MHHQSSRRKLNTGSYHLNNSPVKTVSHTDVKHNPVNASYYSCPTGNSLRTTGWILHVNVLQYDVSVSEAFLLQCHKTGLPVADGGCAPTIQSAEAVV